MINKNELVYKLETIIQYLKDNNGYNYKLYNHPIDDIEDIGPNSNIVEYAEDIRNMIIDLTTLYEGRSLYDEYLDI